jgi:hypothetical protein
MNFTRPLPSLDVLVSRVSLSLANGDEDSLSLDTEMNNVFGKLPDVTMTCLVVDGISIASHTVISFDGT